MQEIKDLQKVKGQLSRQIGERKKAGDSFEDLLSSIQEVSQQIKQKEKSLKEQKKAQENQKSADSLQPDFPLHINHLPKVRKNAPELTIELADQSIAHLWNQYVEKHKGSHIYHRYEFKQVIEDSFNHKCYYFVAYDADKQIVGVMPVVHTLSKIFGNYLTSIPFFNYGGPLADNSETETALITAATTQASQENSKHLEIRESKPRNDLPARTDKVSMFLRLPKDKETLWQDIGTKLRAQIKKGQQNNFDTRFGSIELIDDFYHVFSINMRDLGTPVYSKSFFINLLNQKGLKSSLVVQYHKGNPVSCAFLLGHKDVLEIPWASTLKEANALNANMTMYWQILSFACDQQYDFFDFGRSSKDAGTYKFKKQWGAKPAPLYWHYWLEGGGELPQLNPNNPKYKLVIAIWQKLPVWVTKIVGPFLVKNLP